MSTEWTIKCKTCDVLCEEWVSTYKKPMLLEYIKLWEHIHVIADSQHFVVADEYGHFIEMSGFMRDHSTHELVMHDEYGHDTPLEG